MAESTPNLKKVLKPVSIGGARHFKKGYPNAVTATCCPECAFA
jgi:hypothetical protein